MNSYAHTKRNPLKTKEPDESNDYQTLADLIKDQNNLSDESNTGRHRSNLDSLG